MLTRPEDLPTIARVLLPPTIQHVIDITPNYFVVSPYYLPYSEDACNAGCTMCAMIEGVPVMAGKRPYVAYAQLPRSAQADPPDLQLEVPRVIPLTHVPHKVDHDEQILSFKVDEEQNLLAMATCRVRLGTPGNGQTEGSPYTVYFLRFIQFPNGTTPHPQADKRMIELPTKFRTAEQVAVDIQIQGDHVAVLLNMFHLYVYDWKAGLAKAKYKPSPRRYLSGFSFISDEVLLITSIFSYGIDLLRIPKGSAHDISAITPLLQNVARFLFPDIHPEVDLSAITCTHFSPAQLNHPTINPGATVTFALSFTHEETSRYNVIKFVIPHGGLLQLWNKYQHYSQEHVPWAIWGPTHTIMFDGTYAMDSSFNLGGDFFTSYSDEDNIHGPGFELSAYKLSWPQRSHQVQNCTLHFRWLKDGVLRKTVPVFVTAPGRCVETWLGYEHVVKVVVPHQTMLGYGRRLFGFTARKAPYIYRKNYRIDLEMGNLTMEVIGSDGGDDGKDLMDDAGSDSDLDWVKEIESHLKNGGYAGSDSEDIARNGEGTEMNVDGENNNTPLEVDIVVDVYEF